MKYRALFSSAVLATACLLLPGLASAQECSVNIDSTDAMRYDKDVIVVDKACKEFTVNLTHSGKLGKNVMGHNWVLSKAGDVAAIAKEGISAGLENNYLKPEDERVIAYTEIIGGGQETSVTFPVDKIKAAGEYVFFCSFPGHSTIMRGTLSLK